MLSKRHDPMSWGNRRSEPNVIFNRQVYNNGRQTPDLRQGTPKTGTAYTPAPLIQQIPHLIRHRKGDPADAHELLIALINDIGDHH